MPSLQARTYVEDTCSDGSSDDADVAGFGGAITSPVKLAEICSKHAEVCTSVSLFPPLSVLIREFTPASTPPRGSPHAVAAAIPGTVSHR